MDTESGEVHAASMALGHAIREVRAPRTQGDLATALRVNQVTVSRWERGERQPSLDEILTIESFLGVGRGALLIRAGLVAVLPVPAAILGDAALDIPATDVLLAMYGVLCEQSALRRGGEHGE